jgi:hypothetical protein
MGSKVVGLGGGATTIGIEWIDEMSGGMPDVAVIEAEKPRLAPGLVATETDVGLRRFEPRRSRRTCWERQ